MIDYKPDELDLQILRSLQEDATRSHKEIGALVHLTGQAVGARIRKLEDAGILEGYTIRCNPERIGKPVHALVTSFLSHSASHHAFQQFLKQDERVEEAHRVAGEGCYWLRVRTADNESLNDFLNDLLRFGNYRCSSSIGRIK
jgi:Lrp/AsnC family leucine-responsive transcriptional regulator